MEMECKNAWDYLKIINKYDNTGATTQQEQSEQVSGYTMPELPKYSNKMVHKIINQILAQIFMVFHVVGSSLPAAQRLGQRLL